MRRFPCEVNRTGNGQEEYGFEFSETSGAVISRFVGGLTVMRL